MTYKPAGGIPQSKEKIQAAIEKARKEVLSETFCPIINDKIANCSPAQAAAAERERWGRALDKWFKDHDCWKSEHGNYWTPVPFPASDLMQLIDTLRSQPEKQQEAPKRDEFKHALDLVDDVIYYREENGDDLTYESLHTELETLITIHESNKGPECGACTGPDPLGVLMQHAKEEYSEADLSDNEREMQIHLEYINKIAAFQKQGRS